MAWLDRYKAKLRTADDALKCMLSGDRVYIHYGCAVPSHLVEAMCKRGPQIKNVEVVHLLTMGETKYTSPEMEGRFRHNALFMGANVRQAVNERRADFTPIFLSEAEMLFARGILPIDIALIQVSVPDQYGYCSFGVGVETTKTAADVAKIVIAQVNKNMPRTLGDCFIHMDKVTYFVEHDEPLKELVPGEKHSSEEEKLVYKKIGGHIAGLIEDGSTIQTGIGAIPDAVLKFLGKKKNLGIHTEMFSDGVISLVEDGVINNEKKTIHRGKIIAAFVLGTRAIFDFIDNNPVIEFHPSAYVNDPFIISQNEKMVAINSALEVDMTGQVCADSLGPRFYSGFGGQLDFIRGASRSKGGKPIIALPSTAKGGSISRIVPYLTRGSGVTTTRADVHYVVTENGVADLYGKTIRQRNKALIDIAHPKFQEQLDREYVN